MSDHSSMSLAPPPLPVLRPEPEVAERESSTGRRFPCPQCGAKLDFEPGQRALRCAFCGYAEKIDPDAGEVQERDWDAYWQQAEGREATIAGRSSEVRCKACAAVVLLEDKVVIDECPYCGNELENEPVAAHKMILPEGILPFQVDLARARSLFREWTAGLWFAPNDLRNLANLDQPRGVYIPFWTFDAMTFTRYTGQRGDNYHETESYVAHETFTETDSRGNLVSSVRPVTRTRTVTRVRWSPAAGSVERFFDDVLVCASKSIPYHLMLELAPWDLQHVEPFKPEFLAGFQTERYTVDLEAAFNVARGIMAQTIRTLCCQNIGGDQQQLHTMHTQHAAVTFKHILQPVWLAPYRYYGKLYRIAVNARTGEVVGERPYSKWKIFLFALLVAGLVALVALIVSGGRISGG
ncbi:MAG: hypothetical protein ACT4QC_13305 [Planctomycetaceae bacterium]